MYAVIVKHLPVAVHPRGRGEHDVGEGFMPADFGSSPRARGTSAGSEWSFCGSAVHPRGRGEHKCGTPVNGRLPGSSPRARGTSDDETTMLSGTRFIPAGAGNIRPVPSSLASKPVHPRGRGEHVAHADDADAAAGSSPRARGTFDVGTDHQVGVRFIPAGAGNIP